MSWGGGRFSRWWRAGLVFAVVTCGVGVYLVRDYLLLAVVMAAVLVLLVNLLLVALVFLLVANLPFLAIVAFGKPRGDPAGPYGEPSGRSRLGCSVAVLVWTLLSSISLVIVLAALSRYDAQ